MKALVIPEAGRLELTDIRPPQPGPYDALVRNEVCGICSSTDSKLIDGQMFWAPPFPIALGHESCGTVIEVGAKVKKFKVGDRVTRSVVFWPGSRDDLNPAMGGFSELGIVRDAQAMAADGDPSLLDDYTTLRQNVVPASIDPLQASLAISLAETASVLRRLPNLRGQTIAVAGAGTAGLAFMLWCKLAGARVVALARRDAPLDEAKRIAADLVLNTKDPADPAQALCDVAGGPLDGIIEATGAVPLANALLASLTPSGFACSYGVPPTGSSYDARWQAPEVEEHLAMPWICDLLSRQIIDPTDFYSHEFTLDDIETAFAEVREKRVKKALIRITP